MSLIKQFYPETHFGGFTDCDGTVVFFLRVNALLGPNVTVADIGCGRGEYQEDPVATRRSLRILKGKAAKIIGLDVDPVAETNPFIDEFHLVKDDTWSLTDQSVDLIVCDNVVEHMLDPEKFFSECARVLKKGGNLCIRTPNAWNYIGIASRLVPNKFHTKVLSSVQESRKALDVFPTYYRCNSISQMRATMKKYGFDKNAVYGYEAEPSYLSFAKAAYWLGTLHQKFAPGFMKAAIFAFGEKS
jgi:SAM-dependent methyltransferase